MNFARSLLYLRADLSLNTLWQILHHSPERRRIRTFFCVLRQITLLVQDFAQPTLFETPPVFFRASIGQTLGRNFAPRTNEVRGGRQVESLDIHQALIVIFFATALEGCQSLILAAHRNGSLVCRVELFPKPSRLHVFLD